MRPKKVLLVITKSDWGGAQRYVYDLATSLAASGIKVAVALGAAKSTGTRSGLLATRLTEAGVRTIPIKSFTRDLGLGHDLRAFFEILRVLRAEKPEVLHLNSSKAGGLGALAGRLAGTPRVVFTAHGWPFAERRNLPWRVFAWFGSWATALLSHVVIVVSRADLALGRRLPFCRRKMRLVWNGIAPMTFGDGSAIRSAFPPGARIIGTVGELNANKNQIALIEEARRDPSMHVAIVGEGELRSELESAIRVSGLQNRVKLFGFMPASEVLKGFDAFALPSLKEGLPYVLLEARAAGLPVVLTNRVGGIGEILDAQDLREFSLDRMIEKTIEAYRR